MSREVKQLDVSSELRVDLKKGYKAGKSHCFCQRCQIVLLKSEGYRSKEIGSIVGCCEMRVNNWINHFEKEGREGLKTKGAVAASRS